MASLFNFTTLDIPEQLTDTKSYGPKSATKFRLTSTFEVVSENMAYAMVRGRILLQQQTGNSTKVNLILKPDESVNFKIPVKYFIYRGLKVSDFLNSDDLTAPATHVKTSGTELLEAIQAIQTNRAPNDEIPVEALFGFDLDPSIDQDLDDFFFATTAPNSQLFPIEGGIALGKYSNGDAGIEIVLKNPEYFPDVEMARKSFYEINVAGDNNIAYKWKREWVHHFVDPAAFYGMHYDIANGIGYRDGTGERKEAATNVDIYENILLPFATKNKIYLDIRNENGYSYNFYNNYIGTGTDANKELKTGISPSTLTPIEYSTLGWPIHVVTGVATSPTEDFNSFHAALRINDNEKPLLAGDAKMLPEATGPDSDQAIKFLDEHFLLPSPVPNPLPEFTEAFQLKVPNYVEAGSHDQMATIISLKYIKQIRLDDPVDTFPINNASDHLFGPILTRIPWDSADAIQWIGSNHYKYYDGLNQGFAFVSIEQSITALDSSQKTIKIGIDISGEVTDKVEITNTSSSANTGTYSVKDVEVNGSSETTITVRESIAASLQTGDTLKLKIEVAVYIDYLRNKLIAEGINMTDEPGFAAGEYIRLYTKKGDAPLRYTISGINFNAGNTEIAISGTIKKEGYGALMETGIVAETDVAGDPNPPDGDRIIFYAAPRYYFQKTGIQDTGYFNYVGATDQGKSFLSTLKTRIPGFEVEKFSLRPQGSNPVATLAYPDSTVAKENLLMLGLSKSDFENLKTTALSELSIFHLQMIKLIPQGNRKRDLDYEAYYEYHAVVTGLNANGDYTEAVPSSPVVVYSRDSFIYTSADYATAEEVNVAELNNEETYHLITNYTSKLGTNQNSTLQYLYETLGVMLKAIVVAFENDINLLTTSNFNDEVEDIILEKGKLLLDTAQLQIRDPNSSMYNKDGALYLARLQMRKAFKENNLVKNSFISLTKISDYLNTLEKITRGLHPSNLPDFSTHPDHIPILISGFDPFYKVQPGSFAQDDEGFITNPSGALALALNNVPIESDPNIHPEIPPNIKIIVKSVIFPVRYKEFDDGWIEDFFGIYINEDNPEYNSFISPNNPVKVIITFSHGVYQEMTNFQIERFAARNRTKYIDNEISLSDWNISNYLKQNDKNFYEYILNNLPPEVASIEEKIKYDQSLIFQFSYVVDGLRHATPTISKGQSTYNIDNLLPIPALTIPLYQPENNEVEIPENATNIKILSVKGSGGAYLSNEIFYRVAFLRVSTNTTCLTGHIHVAFTEGDKNSYYGESNKNIMIESTKIILLRVIQHS